jgi:two-component system, cell cycle response regulator
LVDDSASARALLGVRLRERAYDVVEVAHAAEAAEIALGSSPDAVVTDLWMPGISGLQLCRLLRAEPGTAHVPVVLLTASDDRRSRFWARHAGATAYVTKTEIDRLIDVLGDLTSSPKTRPPPSPSPPVVTRGNVQERLSQLLDVSLFESTIAGEVRALSQKAEELEQLFEGLAALASDVTGYRWLALATDSAAPPHVQYKTRLFIHTHVDQSEIAEREARDALEIPHPPERRKPAEGDAFVVADKRPVEAEWSTPPITLPVRFGTSSIGQIALAPARRGASHEDRRFVALLANELGGPLRMASLVAEARRLASTDTLTGLLNRRAFVERIEKARAAAGRGLFPMSMLLLDVDHFKKVNDTLGHDAGDAVLQGVARVLSAIARKSDFVARWGGEEFVLALAQTAEAGARVAAERVRRAIAEARYILPNGTEHRATASVGLASADGPDWLFDDLLARADKAMYAAKHRGRNRVEMA